MENYIEGTRRELGKLLPAITLCATLLLATVLTALPIPAQAAFPGANGSIAFVSNRDGNDEIYVMNPDGKVQTRLTYNTYPDEEPAWSPDGSKIAFDRYIEGQWQIYVMNADGTAERPLTSGTSPGPWDHFAWHPAWSPDGSKIVFVSDRDHPNYEIYWMNAADGSGVTRLTYNTNNDQDPAWSPDGSKIVFVSDRDGNYEIYVMKADGTDQTRLTVNTFKDQRPVWSPDGSKIVFESDRGGGSNIYVVSIDDALRDPTIGPRPLTTRMTWDGHGAWSPDGLKIAFHTRRDRDTGEIYVMNAVDGKDPQRLTFSTSRDTDPDWQPIVGQPPPTTAAATITVTSVAPTAAAATVTVTSTPPTGPIEAPSLWAFYFSWLPVVVSVVILILALLMFRRALRAVPKETTDRGKYATLLAQLDRLHERGEISETLYLRLREEYEKRRS